MQTKGLVIHEGTERIAYEDLDIADPGPRDAVVFCRYVGICRTDVELLEGVFDEPYGISYPHVIGHEWSGVIGSVGSEVTGFQPGDPVIGEGKMDDHRWFGINAYGAAMDRFVVPVSLLHKVPETIDLRTAALIEPFSIGFRAISIAAPVDGSHVVAIIGGGMIGQAAQLVARKNGATTILIEPLEQKRELGVRMGADHVIDPFAVTDLPAEIAELTGLPGADVVVEASGSAPGMAMAYDVAGFEGRIVQAGAPTEEQISAPLRQIQLKNLTILGFTGPGSLFSRAIRFLERHRLDIGALISHEFGFENVNDALATVRQAEGSLKTVLRPS